MHAYPKCAMALCKRFSDFHKDSYNDKKVGLEDECSQQHDCKKVTQNVTAHFIKMQIMFRDLNCKTQTFERLLIVIVFSNFFASFFPCLPSVGTGVRLFS